MNTVYVIASFAILPLCQGLPSLAQTLGIHSSGRTSSSPSEGSIVKEGKTFVFREGRTDREASLAHSTLVSLIVSAFWCIVYESRQD